MTIESNLMNRVMADCFVLSGKDGWDSKEFVNQLFHTEWGRNILKGIAINEFTCKNFMYEGLKQNLEYKSGPVYTDTVLWYAGFLYKYLCETCNIDDVYNKASIQRIDKRFGFYHTQDWAYVKEDLGL